jgi:2'-5' RNA ligase
MPLHSVEALLDAATDHRVRGEWAVLRAAGVPSRADHQGDSNAPHLTLSASSRVPDVVEARLAASMEAFEPVPVRLGALLVLGSRRLVLARLVVPNEKLLELHATVATAMADAPDVPGRVAPGHWVPHVTLARGLDLDQVAAALAALGPLDAVDGTLESVRRWDPDAGRTWRVGGIPTMGP